MAATQGQAFMSRKSSELRRAIFLIPPILIFVMIMNRWSVPQAGLAGIGSVIALAGLKGVWDLAKKAFTDGIGVSDVYASARAGVGNILGALERGARQALPICAAAVGTAGASSSAGSGSLLLAWVNVRVAQESRSSKSQPPDLAPGSLIQHGPVCARAVVYKCT